MALSDAVKSQIETVLSSDRVVLFMKGNKEQPQCGFSATVVDLLNDFLPAYTTFNILEDSSMREGIKEYASWPTIPQLYVEGEFVGGCDIIKEMHEKGELASVLKVEAKEVKAPTINITDSAKETLLNATKEQEDSTIRVRVNAHFQGQLEFSDKTAKDLVVEHSGMTFLFDPFSAERAEGLTLDFVKEGMTSGFKMDMPLAPPKVKGLPATVLNEKIKSGEKLRLVDVRTEQEWSEGHLAEAKLMAHIEPSEQEQWSKDEPIAFICRTGNRSSKVAERFRAHGFKNLYNVEGGVVAWEAEVQPLIK